MKKPDRRWRSITGRREAPEQFTEKGRRAVRLKQPPRALAYWQRKGTCTPRQHAALVPRQRGAIPRNRTDIRMSSDFEPQEEKHESKETQVVPG